METEKKESVPNEQTQEGSVENKESAKPSFDISLETKKLNERLDLIVQRLTQLETKGSHEAISNDKDDSKDNKGWRW